MVEKAEWFLMGKNSIFQNNKVDNFKNLEKMFSFLQAITFDTFMPAN